MSLTELVIQNNPFVHSRFADGEYFCAIRKFKNGTNTSGTYYTNKLSEAIIDSFKYLCNLDNSIFGIWPDCSDRSCQDYIEGLTSKPLKYCNFGETQLNPVIPETSIKLYKEIKKSPRYKILIANRLMTKATYILNACLHIPVGYSNWFYEDFNAVLEQATDISLNFNNNVMFIIAAGMGGKVLIAELHKRIPSAIFIDIGSGLDFICTQKATRGWQNIEYNYEDYLEIFKEIIPDNWNDSKYDYIQTEAIKMLGAPTERWPWLSHLWTPKYEIKDKKNNIFYDEKLFENVKNVKDNKDYSLDFSIIHHDLNKINIKIDIVTHKQLNDDILKSLQYIVSTVLLDYVNDL